MEVEDESPTCEYMPASWCTRRTAILVPIFRVNLEDAGSDLPGTYSVTGYGAAREAFALLSRHRTSCWAVSDCRRSVCRRHLIYGGDWAIRFRPDDSGEPWSVDSSDQWGEPYLILTQEGDTILDD